MLWNEDEMTSMARLWLKHGSHIEEFLVMADLEGFKSISTKKWLNPFVWHRIIGKATSWKHFWKALACFLTLASVMYICCICLQMYRLSSIVILVIGFVSGIASVDTECLEAMHRCRIEDTLGKDWQNH